MIPISICIPVLNEEKNLPGCLRSLRDHFDDIVVVDSKSTDQTRKIVSDFGAKLLTFSWDGTFPKKRNWALRSHQFQHPWILFLDADERVTPAFLAELKEKLNSGAVGFWLNYDNWFMGRKLKHGDRMRKLSLFRIGSGEFEKFPEKNWSPLDMEVHEHPVLEGKVGEIKAQLEHFDIRGLGSYIGKHNEYSTWEANRYLWLDTQDREGENWAHLSKRQRLKYTHLMKWWYGTAYFLLSFALKRGFLDGLQGYRFAMMKKRYFEDIRLKIAEAQDAGNELPEPSVMSSAEKTEESPQEMAYSSGS